MDQKMTVEELLHRPITREILVGLKTRSLRRRVWFRVLDRIERGLVDLTIRWVDNVRSKRMARVLVQILAKLVRALDERMVRVLSRGRERALRLSQMALEWGDMSAYAWRFDEKFQRALGLGIVP